MDLTQGLLRELYGAAIPFFAGAAFATITLPEFLMLRRRLKMAPFS